MKLLHHNESELSRALLAALPEGVEVIEGDGGYPVSAYPSVVITVPPYSVQLPALNEAGELTGVEVVNIPEREEVLRLPATWDAVQQYVDAVNARAASQTPEVFLQYK